jgi:hypothetical protein
LAGKIIGVEGSTLVIKTAQDEMKVAVSPDVMVIAASKGHQERRLHRRRRDPAG